MTDSWGPHVVTAGAASVPVEVPAGTPMSGYAARISPSSGVHDPLTVRALVVDDVGIVTVDCVSLRKTTCGELRASRPAGLLDVVINVIHTHSGPCLTPSGIGTFAPEVLHAVEEAFVEALTLARDRRTPVTIRYGSRRGVGVGTNRRHPERSIDPPVQVIAFDAADHTVATLVTYPMHPVVLGAANTLVSADFVAPLRTAVEKAFPSSVCLFAQGCAGDVNDDVHSPESDFSTQLMAGRDFEAAADKGGRVAEAALRALAEARPVQPARTTIATTTVPVDLTALSPAAVEADRDAWQGLAATLPPERSALYEVWASWADTWLAQRPDPGHWLGRVNLLAVGDVRIATLPGEPFLAIADRVRSGLGPDTLVLGYTDGVSGYFPTEEEYPFGGYEVEDAHRYYGMAGPYAPGSAEKLADAVVGLSEH